MPSMVFLLGCHYVSRTGEVESPNSVFSKSFLAGTSVLGCCFAMMEALDCIDTELLPASASALVTLQRYWDHCQLSDDDKTAALL